MVSLNAVLDRLDKDAAPAPVGVRVCLADGLGGAHCGRYTVSISWQPVHTTCAECLTQAESARWLRAQRRRNVCVARPGRPNVTWCGLYREATWLRRYDAPASEQCDACALARLAEDGGAPDWRPAEAIAEDYYAA